MDQNQLAALFASFSPDAYSNDRTVDHGLKQFVTTITEESPNLEAVIAAEPAAALKVRWDTRLQPSLNSLNQQDR